MSTTPASPSAPPATGKRRRVMRIVAAIFAVLGSSLLLYWLLVARYHEDTDNAYVQGNVVQITPQIAGTVMQVHVEDTESVQAGQLLVSLDQADARVAQKQAEAQLAQTVREVRTLYTSHRQYAANLVQRQVELTRAEDDLTQRRKQAAKGIISQEELRHAEASVNAARAAADAAREQLYAGQALTNGISVREQPNVKRAAAQLTDAMLALRRTELQAPVSGQIAKRSVQLGQRVSPGTPLMAVVPLDQLWVEANFKEAQLRNMRIGQPVTLLSDLYGGTVQYDGRIVGMGAGTGAAFALLPAQNASGNWIKVVQRVPVRIALDPQQLAAHPLRIGLSMHADVDLRAAQGQAPTRAQDSSAANLHDDADRQIQARIDAIIAANLK
ncbi:MAG TPA: HlyD family efflux transporter periplasmic adaptor subunit [Gallionellaceae bacterium]|nr:HlyD family efflux transporter periplasmic adaptor subunit [Gallionellaceae bacterium]